MTRKCKRSGDENEPELIYHIRTMSAKYKRLVIGGTFDLLHDGHKSFLKSSFNLADFVLIGLTTDRFNSGRGKTTALNEQQREDELTEFLNSTGFSGQYKVVPIINIEGETLKDELLEAIVVTADTEQNAHWINNERLKLGMSILEIIKIPMITDTEDRTISSSRIRNGEIDSTGQVFKNFLYKIAGKKLGQDLRSKLKVPQGRLINAVSEAGSGREFVVVGDITAKSFYESGSVPSLSVIDFKTKREEQFKNLNELHILKSEPDFSVSNPAGEISKELIDAIYSALIIDKKQGTVIMVDGEEDLAVIPAVLLSPLGFRVYYGQPDRGIIEITVSIESKKRVSDLISGM